MSHPNPAGNGCSLEDCYTNLFALTDICGIKWRRLATNPDSNVLFDHLEDPVLVSYSKCIQSDILCVWRRIQTTAGEHRTDHLSFNKELWIFWYGDEPANLDSHVSKDLTEKETGSWDKGKDHGLSYECRTLLFKALHNLIERCLLTKGFVRLGRWFVQPYDTHSHNTDRQTHLSFSFNFFLHGESSVCASIEVKQHPPVWKLTAQHLTLTQENHNNFQVILAPYGLNGTLTGQSYRDTDQHAHKILDEWSRFYPIEQTDKDGDPPALIEVLVAGVRMKYPSSFVLLCDIDDQLNKPVNTAAPASNLPHPQHVVPHSHLTPPASPADMSLLADHGAKGGHGASGYGGTHHMEMSSELIARSERVFSKRIQEKVIQDNCINNVISKRSVEASIDDPTFGMWDFNDPTTKQNCNCSRHRLLKNKPTLTGPSKGQPLPTSKHGKGDSKQEKGERPPSRLGRSTPFHRQSTVGDASLDIDLLVQRVPVQGVNFTPAPVSSALPQLNNSGEGNTGIESVQSPAAVPSPLEEPHSQSHASQSGEPTMPKLSPHPPPEVPEKEGNAPKPPAGNVGNLVNGHVDFAKPFDVSTPKTAENVFSPPAEQSEAKNASINRWIKSNHLQQKPVEIPGIKRPLLPTQLTDGDPFVTQNLYNLDRLNVWLNIPVVKKPKYEPLSPDGDSPNLQKLRNSPQSMEDDPYEFSDEASINPATITNRKMRDSREEGFHNKKSPYGRMEDDFGRLDSNRDDKGNEPSSLTSPPATPNTLKDSLMQVNDLVPKKTDLDHIFESDSDNDDPFISNTESAVSEDIKHTKVLMAPTEGVIASSDLIRMYPTPPSNNPEISPASYHHEAVETYERPVIKKEINVPSMEEFFKDVPSVFQPPEQDEFVSSDKYSTVTLPKLSPIHHPPEYKASWQYPMPIMEKPPPNSYNIPSIENIPSLPSRMNSSAIESSPAMFQTPSVGTQRTPMSYELQSPASNASSYLNKTLNSVDNQGTNNQIAEVHSLVVNILLMDSRLNVFKDANFDSCNFCVCNGNIKGADTGILIEDPTGEAQYSCTCGFSAIRNRRFGINAGLFYEDEVDITGVRNDRFDRRKPGLLSLEFSGEHKGDDPNILVLELLLGQFTVPYPSHSSSQLLIRLGMETDTSYASVSVDDFPLKDGNEVSYMALDQGRQAMEHCVSTKIDDPVMKSTCLHKWQFLKGATKIPLNPQDSQHLLKSLQPILQDAIQNKRVTRLWEQTFKLAGPLTWKEFHQLAGRGSEENSSPQPIPALLVGNDRDWLSISPYSLRFWEKQFMEPYGKQRDIAYVVLAPDNNYVIDYVKVFFKELSNVYELCRFGRHAPFAKKLRDGIMRIGKKQAASKSDEPEEDWFKQIGESPLSNKLKLFSQVCTSWLAPLLSQQTLDQSVFEPNTNYRAGYKPSEPSQVTSDHVFTVPQTNNVSEDKENTQTAESNNFKDISFHENDREKPMDCPALVVYIIDPFNYGQSCDGDSDIDRIIKIGLLKCFLKLVQSLPEHLQQNMYLQIIPLHTVLECTEKGSNIQQLKAISFSVFTTCRWNSSHTILGRSLTGFGPAAAAEIFLKKKDQKEKTKLYCPPFVIAPTKDKQAMLAECHGEKLERSNVIHCTYCLSEDQRWLIAVCTDEQGELMETVTINIEIPNRNRRKKASARKIGLKKLWDFILGVVTMTSIPSRLVIGRFGRMGHGELKGWSGLLSKKNIQKAIRHIKELCPNVCSNLSGNSEIPGILSVCLISLESHSSFQVLADVVKAEEKMSSNCPLQTPQDASCTHILVFPTSANAQANSTTMMPNVGDNLGLGNIDDVMDDENILSNLHEDFKMDNDFNDGFLINVFEEITNSPNTVLPGGNTSNPGSPTDNGRHSLSAMNSSTSNSQELDPQDEPPNLLQQPLAMGYLVSSAETGPLPKWFWSTCPENEHHKPHTFKAALHIQSNQEEFMPSSQRNSHPLDSSITCDVLRYVLENYNALSWLTFDPVKNDRQSSLPIHMVVLMQMYHALNAFL